jgi:hypothetical protein
MIDPPNEKQEVCASYEPKKSAPAQAVPPECLALCRQFEEDKSKKRVCFNHIPGSISMPSARNRQKGNGQADSSLEDAPKDNGIFSQFVAHVSNQLLSMAVTAIVGIVLVSMAPASKSSVDALNTKFEAYIAQQDKKAEKLDGHLAQLDDLAVKIQLWMARSEERERTLTGQLAQLSAVPAPQSPPPVRPVRHKAEKPKPSGLSLFGR